MLAKWWVKDGGYLQHIEWSQGRVLESFLVFQEWFVGESVEADPP